MFFLCNSTLTAFKKQEPGASMKYDADNHLTRGLGLY